MASAGWQGQKDFQTSKHPYMAMNLNVWNVSHSGTTLTFSATVRSIVTGGRIDYSNCSVSLTGGGSKSINMHKSTGGYVDTGTFTCTVTGVPAGANTYKVTASFSAGSVASGSASWALDIGATGNPPSGAGVSFISSTWNSVTSNNTVADWGSWSNCFYAAVVVTGNINGEVDNMPDAQWTQWSRWHTIEESDGGDSKILTVSPTATGLGYIGSPVPLKGMLHYKLVSGPYNDYGNASAIDSTLRYLKPAAPQFSYTDPGTIGTKTYPVTFTGDLINNNTTYNTANLTRYVRYKIDNGNWTVVENNTNKALDAVTSFNVVVPASSTATIEGYMTYHGMQSETTTLTISNTNIGSALYGSVSDLTKQFDRVYAAIGNYFDNRHWLTGRESYASVETSGNSVTLTKVSSGSGGYNWVAFPIDVTDEIINKQITLTGEFETSGNFTSGPRLWWLNSTNTGILSGPVASIEYIGNSGRFSVTGTIPSRPSNAGKLALLLYSNIASAAQGVYTVYRNVELRANTKNMFNYLKSNYPSTKGGVTVSRADDGTFTATGILSTNYQVWGAYDITDQLEDGCAYTFSQTNNTSGKFYMQMPAHKRDGSGTTYYNIGGATQTSFVVDKTTYDKYTIQFQTGTTSQWGTASQTITQKFQLEKGSTATSFAPFVDTKTHRLRKIYASVNGVTKLIFAEE